MRAVEEEIPKCLGKVASSIARKKRKLKKTKGKAPPTSFSLLKTDSTRELVEQDLNEASESGKAWGQLCGDGETFLRVAAGPDDAFMFRIVVNPPRVTSLTCKLDRALVGYPLLPNVEAEFASKLRWEWVSDSGTDERVVGTERIYIPSPQDQGCMLRVRCTPCDHETGQCGRSCAHFIPAAVEAAPQPAALELRREYLARELPPGSFRVVCYNILSKTYCLNAYADTKLYPYCDNRYRQTGYRMQLVLKELASYRGDICCLQECDARTFDEILFPYFSLQGYQGRHSEKSGTVAEGCAMFYNSSRFTLESFHPLSMKEIVPKVPELQKLWQEVPHALEIVVMKLTTIAQIATFEVVGQPTVRLLCVNTHLFYHPDAPHMRLMQLVALMRKLQELREGVIARGLTPRVVTCGDFNSIPTSVVRYLLGDEIGPDHHVWRKARSFCWGARQSEAEAAPAADSRETLPAAAEDSASESGGCHESSSTNQEPNLSGIVPPMKLSLDLFSCYGDGPEFTNFTPDFTETLDYILVDRGFQVAAVAPFPEEEALRQKTPGLPTEEYPSDHLALVADLLWGP
ncbi:unnamed protein product [Chrysoparadoxa australica]